MPFAKQQHAYKPELANLSTNFEEILSRALENYEEQNKGLEPSIVIILLLLLFIALLLTHIIIIW
jgi:hypothetical protein